MSFSGDYTKGLWDEVSSAKNLHIFLCKLLFTQDIIVDIIMD